MLQDLFHLHCLTLWQGMVFSQLNRHEMNLDSFNFLLIMNYLAVPHLLIMSIGCKDFFGLWEHLSLCLYEWESLWIYLCFAAEVKLIFLFEACFDLSPYQNYLHNIYIVLFYFHFSFCLCLQQFYFLSFF